MSLILKTGPGEPRLFGLRPEMVIAVIVMLGAYTEEGADCVITTGIDGKHADGSSHYNGCALDFRTNNLAAGKAQTILDKFKARVTADYFAQLEDDHIHVQFKPKLPYTG